MKYLRIWMLLAICLAVSLEAMPVLADNSTTSLHLIRYADDGQTVLEEVDVTSNWLEQQLPVLGDGTTHYYHQGPVFEGDMWDPEETVNLKDKGAVKGTDARDLCELVGGMVPGDVISFRAADGWHTEFAYENIYEPLARQGSIAVCWYNGEDSETGEKYGTGYPGLEGYHSAMQIVVMAGTTNEDGLHVFGNEDMRVCLPQEEYQHFYEGLPSTNGLSGKWISEIIIYSQEPAGTGAEKTSTVLTNEDEEYVPGTVAGGSSASSISTVLWAVIGCGVIGIALISIAILRARRKG